MYQAIPSITIPQANFQSCQIPGNFFGQISGGPGFPETLNLNKFYTSSPFQDLNH